jgi:hypothetical protein
VLLTDLLLNAVRTVGPEKSQRDKVGIERDSPSVHINAPSALSSTIKDFPEEGEKCQKREEGREDSQVTE